MASRCATDRRRIEGAGAVGADHGGQRPVRDLAVEMMLSREDRLEALGGGVCR
jgi:hypothetical protein